MLKRLFKYFSETFLRAKQASNVARNDVQVNTPAKPESNTESEPALATELATKIPVTEMMRLLHTRSLTFTEFRVSQVPDYAILSHRWLKDEVTYSDMCNLTDELKQTSGYKKIVNCCKQAASVGLDCKFKVPVASVWAASSRSLHN